MGDHDSPSTCLSSEPHEPYVRDAYLHYSGCLRNNRRPTKQETERQEYFDSLKPHKQERIRREEKRIHELRALFEDLDRKETSKTSRASSFNESLRNWRVNWEYPRRTRGFVSRPWNDAEQPTDKHKPLPGENHEQDASREDVVSPSYETPTKDNGFGMSAYAIFLRSGLPYNDENCSDKFPNQKISIEELLLKPDEATNPLMRKCEENEIRYFHLPGNNMHWVEVT